MSTLIAQSAVLTRVLRSEPRCNRAIRCTLTFSGFCLDSDVQRFLSLIWHLGSCLDWRHRVLQRYGCNCPSGRSPVRSDCGRRIAAPPSKI